MSSIIVAIPSKAPGGLEAGVDSHFGHCEMYTLVSLEEGKAVEVNVIPNIPHEQGGCLAPVNYLAGHKVQALISGGMGARPLMGFRQVGIDVFFGNGAANVQEAIEGFAKGALPRFSEDYTCGGGSSPHGCGNH